MRKTNCVTGAVNATKKAAKGYSVHADASQKIGIIEEEYTKANNFGVGTHDNSSVLPGPGKSILEEFLGFDAQGDILELIRKLCSSSPPQLGERCDDFLLPKTPTDFILHWHVAELRSGQTTLYILYITDA